MQENYSTRTRSDKIIDRVLLGTLIVLCIVLLILGIDIEKKLKSLNESDIITTSQQAVLYETVPVETTAFTEVSTALYTEAVTAMAVSDTSYIQTETTIITTEQTTVPTTQTTVPSTELSTTAIPTTVTTTVVTTAVPQTITTVPATVTSTAPPTAAHQTVVATTAAQSDGKYYITASGTKYHISTCSHLKKTKIEIELNDAISKGYEPCSRCIK